MASLSQTAATLRNALPASAIWIVGGLTLVLDFSRLQKPLKPLSELEGLHGLAARPSDWGLLVPFGEMRVDGGASPLYCLNGKDSSIYCVDVERESDEPSRFLNSSASRFIDCFRLINEFIQSGGHDVVRILKELEHCDGEALTQNSEWRRFVEHLRSSD